MPVRPASDYSSYRHLVLDLRDGIMTLTLSNPRRKNAVTEAMGEELTTIWHDLWRDPEVRVIILTGEGDTFCAGYDLNVAGTGDDKEEQFGKMLRAMTRITRLHMTTMLECEKPIISKVRGVAYGLGANMALASDLVYAAENARFADPHVRAGIAAGDGGVLLWPLAVGFHRAKEYLMTGDPVSAREASNIGLINHCVAEEELDERVQAMAAKLRDLPPNAVNLTKSALNVALRQMTQSAFDTALAYELYTLKTDDFREATAAFLEKRKGVYTGK